MLIRFLIPFFILGPSYFNGDVSLGRLFQLVHALGEVGSAFDLLVTMCALGGGERLNAAERKATWIPLVLFGYVVQLFFSLPNRSEA